MDYHVEELADSSGVAVDTIRYYQREKLLAPPRREGRRAFYDDAHLERIQEIRSLAQQGFSLAQIRELSAGDGSGLLVDLAQQNAVDPDLDKAELARRAEIPEFLIDVVVSAGLLTPSGEGDDQRFAADAVDMLVAARTLVNEGVSLEELTALAMRHATHIENVVDDAIELFKRNSRRHDADGAEGGGHDDLVSLMHRLVPVASNLVGQHFERTLRTRALARLGDDTPVGGGVVVFARKLDERVDPVAIYAAATDHHRSLWIRPDEQFALVALGAAELVEPHGDSRFSAASAARAALSVRIRRHGPADAPAPVMVGGFSFTTGTRPIAPDWSGFPDARWALPEVTVVDRPDGSWLLAATSLDEGDDEGAALDMLEARLEEMATAPAPTPAVLGEIVRGDATHDDPDYVRLVAEAIGDIRSGELDKVVLARVFTRGPIDTPAVLRALAERFPTCATFAFGVGNREFIGASPERLVTLDGREVSTVALAGTTGTGGDETSDAELAAEMMASPKIRAEHQFVVDDITARLATLGLVGETPVEPDVMRLARVQHLRTPITARVERRSGGVSDMDVIRVANVLHPSPAVGGTPSDPAVEWILANERFDRGWYAAPVGWTDLDGNGELRVALRSALVDESQVQLFSGAGIVADSDPDDELAETGVKLRALLDVMESAR